MVGVLYWFNARSPVDEKYLVTNIGALFWLPMLVILIVLREEPSSFGLTPGDQKRGLLYAFSLLLVVSPFLLAASKLPAFQEYYPLAREAESSLLALANFELSYGVYLFCWEFFFRGFLLFGLSRGIGNWAVFGQAVPFGIMHFGKPMPEVAASFVAGLALGIVALRCRSIVPCFLAHWASAILLDILVIAAKPGGIF